MAGTTVIIPALNEAGNIGPLVQQVSSIMPVAVIVVDNDSMDSTASEARQAGAQVVFEKNRGYGYACAAGVAAASMADILVFMDGDGSFNPADFPALLSPLLDNRADLVLGSRVLGAIDPGSMPFQQYFGNWLVSRLMNLLFGLSLTDLGPYRAIRKKLLEKLFMREMTYGWTTEMIIKAARQKAQITEVAVSYHKRLAGRSKVSGTLRGTFLAAWSILRVTFRYARKN